MLSHQAKSSIKHENVSISILIIILSRWYDIDERKTEGVKKMEQKVKEVFDLDWIQKFVEENISSTEWIEEDGEKRRILVIDTLFDGGHGAYIPGMVLELFGKAAEEYDTEAIYDELMFVEDEINACLNTLLPSRGTYYVGYHEADGSYCLFYEEYEEQV